MKTNKQTAHIIDFLFTIALFGVFAASALLAVIIGANVYKSTTKNMSDNYNNRTSMAYITEKIRQHDESQGVAVENIDGYTCLLFHQTYEGEGYTTYIYADGGWLRELFIRDSLGFSPEMGEAVIEIQSFNIHAAASGLYQLSLVDGSGQSTQMYISVRSEAGSINGSSNGNDIRSDIGKEGERS